jgi:hypothetical protein
MLYSYVSGVEVSIYSGNAVPETKLQSKNFNPKYLNYTSASGQFEEKNKDLSSYATESFVLFDEPAKIKDKFFISYKINYSETAKFCVYNTKFGSSSHLNTAWVKTGTGWIPATDYSYYGEKTTLAIQALLQNIVIDSINPPKPEGNFIYYNRTGQTLFLSEPNSQPVVIQVYSVTGQLMEKTQFEAGQTSCILSPKHKGTIGIIKAIHTNGSVSIKIIY